MIAQVRAVDGGVGKKCLVLNLKDTTWHQYSCTYQFNIHTVSLHGKYLRNRES